MSDRNEDRKAPAAKKSLGQHFLRRQGICERIADLVGPEPEDNLLEIGPGPGALTTVLERRPHARLLLLEKDSYWAGVRAESGPAGTEVRCMDALEFPWEELTGRWKLLGNLPYNVASPLIWDIVSRCHALTRACFMVQKEVGQRIAAAPGSRQYGALSVWVQAFVSTHLEFTVAPGAFVPPPKVDSAVLTFRMLPEPLVRDPDALASVLKLCFQQRRKQLGGIFRRQGREDLLARLASVGVPGTARPEELSVEQFLLLSGQSSGS